MCYMSLFYLFLTVKAVFTFDKYAQIIYIKCNIINLKEVL